MVTSAAVPEVVGTAKIGKQGFLVSAVPSRLTTSSNSGFVAIIPIAFAVSIGEPPPTAIKQSTSCSLTKATPSFTFSTVGLGTMPSRSEEHTSELQSRFDLVCRLLLEKKNKHYEQ